MVEVLWWRDAQANSDVPRTYGVGWALVDGTAAGLVSLPTPHAWLDATAIEAGIRPALTAALGPVSLAPATGQHNAVADLAQAGHRIGHADLSLTYGLDVVGGVSAELRGRGASGTVVFDRALSTPVRMAVARWAADALNSFRHAQEVDLLDGGWRLVSDGRWQLMAYQPHESAADRL